MKEEKQNQTVKDKLYAVLENAHGATQFIRAHASMAMAVDDWDEQLMRPRMELTAFILSSGKNINSFNDVVQYGSMFLAASEDFLRGEHVKEHVKLTLAERKELKEELNDAFNDDRLKDQLMTKAAAIGWMLYDILYPHLDQQQIEAVIQKKLLSIRLNLVSKFAVDEIQKTVAELKKGVMIAERLEESGLIINADDTVTCGNAHVQKIWDELQDPNHEDREEKAFANDEAANLDGLVKVLDSPVAKMVLSSHDIVTL